ncbi:F-BAR and double SH3 domains protein 2 isoform X1 [Electrophorus electricus]|uniref:F-BAR and double SH3 domains protein 2 isoform X1 n=1 Tax=Electrophorus electricus TaxID=8005 RepID=UPI0015CFD1B5|nr:F-BAR and double SH3 domains protein 2 isoform X1 [Electrophorus electricus]
MQPPPRKVKVSQELKHAQAEQLNRLHVKHQLDCDLLEDLRTYSQKKAVLEKDYAQALQKLASQYLKREWPGIQSEEQKEYRNVCTVWRAYLEGVVKVTQSRISGSDSYKSQVSEPIKTFRTHKEQQLKKCIEQLTRIQAELQDTVKDLTKSRKQYQETEQMAQAVREKADMEAKSKLSLFQSRSSLKRASVKLKAKRNECNSKATHARNEYLLTLAAANAHQGRYYDNDLLCCIKVLDGSVYDHMKGYLVSLCQAELEAAHTVQDTFNFLLEKSTGVMQDFHQELFIQENPVFQQAQLFQFQPCDNDPVSQLQKETGTAEEHSLNKEARRWATRVAREHKNIMHHQRTLSECEGSLQQEQNSGELDLKVEESRESIRKAETVKLKAEARLNLLRDVGVAVDTWLKSAMNQVMEELENERWATLTPHDASLCSTADLDREDDEETEDAETQDDSSSSPCSTLRNYPLTCKVLYSYQASQPDELSIEEQEVLEVIDDGDMEDWVKARNGAGQVGYVPEKYLQLPSSNSLLSMLQSLAALDARSRSSSNSAEQEPEPASEHARTRPSGDDGVSFAKALYDYEAQTEDELSFPEGAIIRILNKDNQEDDGFWEGELNGSMGVFPAVLVEDLAAANGDETPPHRGTETQGCSPRPLSMTQLQASACSSPASSAAPPPLPTPTLPSGPAGASASPLPSPHSLNGFHRPAPGPPKTGHGHSLNSTPPPRYPADGGPGTLRPVRAAPPPPKQQAQGQVQKREAVEITLV